MKRINLKKIIKILKKLRLMTGGIFTFQPAEVTVSIVIRRYGKVLKISFDRTGNVAVVKYKKGDEVITEHVREVKTVEEILREVFKYTPEKPNKEV